MGRKGGARAWQQPSHPLGGSTHMGNRGTLAASAAILFSLPIAGSEGKKASTAKLRGMCVPGERNRLFSLNTRRDGWQKTIFWSHALPNSAGQKLRQQLRWCLLTVFHAQGGTWDQQRRKSHNCAAVWHLPPLPRH